jgi:PKD repeat protein
VGKQKFSRIKKTLNILLVVLFVASLTAGSVSATAKAKGSCEVTSFSCTSDESTYTIKCSAAGSLGDAYAWDFGDGEDDTGKDTEHVYENCEDHTVKLTVTDSEDDSEAVKTWKL